MSKDQFSRLQEGDRVLHLIDGVYGKVYDVWPFNDRLWVLWQDGQRTCLDSTNPDQGHQHVVPIK